LIAIVPAVLVILIYGEEKVDDLLVFSQVILSLQLGFAVIPLIHFVSDKKTMGEFAIKTYTKSRMAGGDHIGFLKCKTGGGTNLESI
jgi:manganese transport protein